MTPPPGLSKLTAKRDGKFAVLWRACDSIDTLPLVAASLAAMDWSVADVAASLSWHPVEPDEDAAQAMAQTACAERAAQRAAEMATELQIVAIYLSTPPQVDVRMGDKVARVAMREVGSRALLRDACLAHFLRPVGLPSAKRYDDWLALALDAAERIEAPADASEDEHERYGIEQVLLSLGLAENYGATEAQRVYVDREASAAYIHMPALMAGKIKPAMPTMTASRVSEILRELGWEPVKIRDGAKVLRLWRGPAEHYLDREAEWAAIEEMDEARRRRLSTKNADRAPVGHAAPQGDLDRWSGR